MKKLFTSLLLLAVGVIVANAQYLSVGGKSIDLSTSKTYTNSDISAIKSGSVTWKASEKKLTLKNATIEATGTACIGAENLGTSGSDRFYIYVDGSATLKTTGNGMRFDDCYVVIYGSDTAYLNIKAEGSGGYVGIDAEKSNLNIWSIGLYINAPNSTGIYGNKNYGSLTFIGTYGDITGGEAAVQGFKNFYLDDSLIDTYGGKFVSSTGITNGSGTLLKSVAIRPKLRVAGVSVRTASNTTSGTNWKWDKSNNTLTITGDITVAGNGDAISNYGIDNLVIKWEGTPTLKNGYTTSGSIIMSKKSIKFSGNGADFSNCLTLQGYVPLYMYTPEENTLTFNNAMLSIDGAGWGIVSEWTNTNMVINQSAIVSRGKEKGSIGKLKSCKMNGCDVYTLFNPGVAYRQSLNGFGTATELFKGEDYLWIVPPTEDYKIEVLGKPVTDANMTDITVDGLTEGKITYDKDSKTLTLTDVKLEAPSNNNEKGLFFSAFAHEDFTVNLVGDNTVTTNNHAVFTATGRKLTFTGSGMAHFRSNNFDGFVDNAGGTTTLYTDDVLRFEGKRYGFYSSSNISQKLVIKKDNQIAYRFKGGEACMYDIHNLDMEGMDFYGGGENLKGCYFDEERGTVLQNGGAVAKGQFIAICKPTNFYNIYVAGKQITDLNKYGVGSKYIVSNISTAVTYDPSMKVLKLNNAYISYDGADSNLNTLKNDGVDNLTILLEGENTIKTVGYVALAAEGNATTSLRGDGKLSAQSNWYAMRIGSHSTLDIGGNVEIEALGSTSGIANNMQGDREETLIIRDKAYVKAKGSSTSVQRLNSIQLLDDIMIVSPDGATIEKDDTFGWGVYYNGQLTNKEVIFADKSFSGIETVELDPNANVKDVYDLSGRQAETLRPGLNIVRMSDGTVRKVMVK